MRWLPVLKLKPFVYVRRSLSRKLLLSFFTIITLMVAVLAINYYDQTSRIVKRQAIDNMERNGERSAATMEYYMSTVKSFAWMYFGDKKFQQFVIRMGQDPEEMTYYQGVFNNFVSGNPFADSVWVSQLDGFSLKAGTSATYASLLESEIARLKEIAIANDGKGTWAASQAIDPESGKLVPTLAFVQALKEIKLTSRPIVGYIVFQLSPDSIGQWFRGMGAEKEVDSYLIRGKDGTVELALHPESVGHTALSGEDLAKIAAQQEYGQARDRHFETTIGGEPSLVVHQSLAGTDWTLVSRASLDALLKQAQDVAKRTALIGSLGLAAAMLMTSLLASRMIVPLRRLREAMKSVEFGNFRSSVPVDTIDEIGYLSRGFNRMTREIDNLIIQAYESELVKKDMEIRSLQSQINPHFLYNTLGTIESLASLQADERIGTISSSLAKMFRYNISGGDRSTLRAEFRQLDLYLSIQKIRYGPRLNYSVYLEPGLESWTVPKLLVQPLVENGILHGIDPIIGGGVVRVEAESTFDREAEIRVWNNGMPIPEGKLQRLRDILSGGSPDGAPGTDSSIGLMNVQLRLRKVYGESFGIAVESSEELGTTFTIRLAKHDANEGEPGNEAAVGGR
jgi:Predicted signal transduction protein with a C-terminal ATPase domain